jgi:hypothetical protein
VGKLLHASLSGSVEQWLGYMRARRRARAVLHKARMRWMQTTVSRAMNAWVDETLRSKRAKRLLARGLGSWQNKNLAAYFRRWLDLLHDKVKDRIIGDTGYIVSTIGFDDDEFQVAQKAAAQRDFFANFRVFTPPLRTEVGSSWVVHTMFDIQEVEVLRVLPPAAVAEPAARRRRKADPNVLAEMTQTKWVSVPSKIVKQSDGPLQILTKGRIRQIELVIQVATMHHFPARAVALVMAPQRTSSSYPAELMERRRIYTNMIQHCRELKIMQEAGTNPQQIKVYAELPDDLLVDTPDDQIALLAFGVDIKYEGFSGIFRCKSLLAAKVFGALQSSSGEETGVRFQRALFLDSITADDSVLPKASYECATDEPAHYRRGKLTVRLQSVSGLTEPSDLSFGRHPRRSRLYCKFVVHHKEKVVAEAKSRLDVPPPEDPTPIWNEEYVLKVPNGDRDLLTVQVWERVPKRDNFLTNAFKKGEFSWEDDDDFCDVYVAYATIFVRDVSRLDEDDGTVEQEWKLFRPDGSDERAGLVALKLRWQKIFTVGRSIDLDSAHRPRQKILRAQRVSAGFL